MSFKKGITIFTFCLAAFCLQLLFFWTGENALSPAAADYKTMLFVTAGTAVMGVASLIAALVVQKMKKPQVGQKVVNYSICSYLAAAALWSF